MCIRDSNWDIITPTKIKPHPKILLIFNIWLKIIQAAIVAKTPSKEKIIAAGAGEMFFCAYIWSTKAIPPDSMPA